MLNDDYIYFSIDTSFACCSDFIFPHVLLELLYINGHDIVVGITFPVEYCIYLGPQNVF